MEPPAAATQISKLWRGYSARLDFRARVAQLVLDRVETYGEDQCLAQHRDVKKQVQNQATAKLQQQRGDSETQEPALKRRRTEEEDKEENPPASSPKDPWLSWPITEAVVSSLAVRLQRGGKLPLVEARLLLAELKESLAQAPNVQVVEVPAGGTLTVVGDTHGQLNDLRHILAQRGWPAAESRYLFNGDYVDRTPSGCEVFLLLAALKLAWPRYVFLNRGNHEDDSMNTMEGYGPGCLNFHRECLLKYGQELYFQFQDVFMHLPLAAHVSSASQTKGVFVVHGGLPRWPEASVAQMNGLDRVQPVPMERLGEVNTEGDGYGDALFCDMLWSDPREYRGGDDEAAAAADAAEREPLTGVEASPRGCGILWGKDVSHRWLASNGFMLMIRSHEVEWDGHAWYHDGKVLSLFSASNYHGELSNFGAYAVLDESLVPEIQQFKAPPLAHQVASLAGRGEKVAKLERAMVQAVAPVLVGGKALLNEGFSRVDKAHCGYVTRVMWAGVLRVVLQLGVPWLLVRRHVVYEEVDQRKDLVNYVKFLEAYRVVHHDDAKLDGLLQFVLRRLLHLSHHLKSSAPSESESQSCSATAAPTGTVSTALSRADSFELLDTDHNGIISYMELKSAVRQVIPDLPSSIIYTLMRTFDVNRDNKITADEFTARFGARYECRHGRSHPPWVLRILERVGQELFRQYTTSAKAYDALQGDACLGQGLDHQTFAERIHELLRASAPATDDVVQDKARLLELAAYIDNNEDGTIQLSEFLEAFQVVDLGAEDARRRLDAEIRSEVGLCIQSHRAPLRAAFQLFDAAGTGKVSLEDFKIAMECLNDVTGGGGGGLREAHALHLGGAAEKDADGKVDYNKWLDGFAAQRV